MCVLHAQELSVDRGGCTIDEALDALVAAEMLTKQAPEHYSYAHSYLHNAAHSLLPVELHLKLNVAAAHYYEERRAESLRILQAEMTARHERATLASAAARSIVSGQARLRARRQGAVSSASTSRMVYVAASGRRCSDESPLSEHDHTPTGVYADHAAVSLSGRASVSSNANQRVWAAGGKCRGAYGAQCSESSRSEEVDDGKVAARAVRLSLLGARAEVDEEALLWKLQHHWCAAVDAGGGDLERLRAVDYLQKVADRSLKVRRMACPPPTPSALAEATAADPAAAAPPHWRKHERIRSLSWPYSTEH